MKYYRVKFLPQRTVGENCYTAPAQGEQTYYIDEQEVVDELGKQSLADAWESSPHGDYSAFDRFKSAKLAPRWVREHSDAFDIQVLDEGRSVEIDCLELYDLIAGFCEDRDITPDELRATLERIASNYLVDGFVMLKTAELSFGAKRDMRTTIAPFGGTATYQTVPTGLVTLNNDSTMRWRVVAICHWPRPEVKPPELITGEVT